MSVATQKYVSDLMYKQVCMLDIFFIMPKIQIIEFKKEEQMRKFLIMCLVLASYAAQARQGPVLTVRGEPTQDTQIGNEQNLPAKEQRSEPVYKRYMVQKGKVAEKSGVPAKEKTPNINKDKSVDKLQQPKKISPESQPKHEHIAEQPAKKADIVGEKRHHEADAVSNRSDRHFPDHRPHHEHKTDKHKSEVKINVNINRPRRTIVADGIVVTQPVTVVRPVIYDNSVYTNNAYSCGERSGVKYCTDYRGRPLNGKIVQNYGENVAYETYRNGYQQGTTTVFSPEGLLMRKTEYKKSLKNGKEYVYYENGKTEYTAEYKKGALHGNIVQYDPNGKIVGRMTYHNGYLRTRRCVYETADPMLREMIKQKNYNELILCNLD